VKFLLNMNLPRELARQLAASGHACRHAADIGLARAADSVIVAEARRQKETVLTHDLDYGNLLAFSGEASPSVVIYRLTNTLTLNLLHHLTSAWSQIEAPLQEGAIVVIEDASVRIRRLPIERLE
jgi:predicted nuclease of predicted toxin-antitoxin system